MHYNEPAIKRAIVFIDGQSLYRSAKEAFGYFYPNYDVKLLSEKICGRQGWQIEEIRFYTGVPDLQDNALWHNFWNNKLTNMGQKGVMIFSRALRYHNEKWECLSCNKVHTSLAGHEKGVDVRIALDVIRSAHEKLYDVAIIFSQDQDLSEVADEVRRISAEQNRWIKVSSIFPASPTYKNIRGINKTDWVTIDRKIYDSCIDPNDYR
jgi:uncharacterized LabA/DUF88 family protein